MRSQSIVISLPSVAIPAPWPARMLGIPSATELVMPAHNPSLTTPLSTDAGRLARIADVTADVSVRLRIVCAHLPHTEFEALVRRIAEVAVKYEALAEMRASRAVRADPPALS